MDEDAESALEGAVGGFVTSGFNPFGAIVGAISGEIIGSAAEAIFGD